MVLRCAIRKAEPLEQREYVRRLLEAYRATPGTCGAVRRPDRLLAAQLYQRGVPLEVVENALTLAAARRLARAADAPPLGIIRSLAYFSPVDRRGPPPPGGSRVLPPSPQPHRTGHTGPVASFRLTAFTPAAWMMLPLSSLSTTCAPTARMMTRAPALSILFPIRVTLTERYWVTSDERRSLHHPHRAAGETSWR